MPTLCFTKAKCWAEIETNNQIQVDNRIRLIIGWAHTLILGAFRPLEKTGMTKEDEGDNPVCRFTHIQYQHSSLDGKGALVSGYSFDFHVQYHFLHLI